MGHPHRGSCCFTVSAVCQHVQLCVCVSGCPDAGGCLWMCPQEGTYMSMCMCFSTCVRVFKISVAVPVVLGGRQAVGTHMRQCAPECLCMWQRTTCAAVLYARLCAPMATVSGGCISCVAVFSWDAPPLRVMCAPTWQCYCG